jgi:hypothetical protein
MANSDSFSSKYGDLGPFSAPPKKTPYESYRAKISHKKKHWSQGQLVRKKKGAGESNKRDF